MSVEKLIDLRMEVWCLEDLYNRCEQRPNDNNRALQVQILQKLEKIHERLFNEGCIW